MCARVRTYLLQAPSVNTECGTGRTLLSPITESLEPDLGPRDLLFHEVQPCLYLRTLSTSSGTNYSTASKGLTYTRSSHA